MNPLKELLNSIYNLSEDAIRKLLDEAKHLLISAPQSKPACPHCQSQTVIKFGFKCGKQRFRCKDCGRTFVTTTHTIMAESHQPKAVWEQVLSDTFECKSIEQTAKELHISHPCVFHMRHKILLGLCQLQECEPVALSEISELDETYVLECYKGKALPESVQRMPRKHGAVAQKAGLSNEQVCILAGVQRYGNAFAVTVNRAKPSLEELTSAFEGHIASGSMLLTDGLRGYEALANQFECELHMIDPNQHQKGSIWHLNNINRFHSFIKEQYRAFRGVATKYLNRYNALFSVIYKLSMDTSAFLHNTLLDVGAVNFQHTICDVKSLNLLVI